MPKRLSLEDFVRNAKSVHGNKYDYSLVVYVNNYNRVNIKCVDHGVYAASPKGHVWRNQGCPICGIGALNRKKHIISNRLTTDQFLDRAKAVHGDKYDYSACVYVGGKVKMPIRCKTHGIFNQHAENHINLKQGCPTCHNESRIGRRAVSGFCPDFFERYPEKKNAPAIFYLAKMEHKNDIFLKVGITTKLSVKQRFYNKAKNGTVITPLVEYAGSLHAVYLLEQKILDALEPYRFFPNRRFAGHTECFKMKGIVIDTITDHLKINIQTAEE